MTKLSTESYKGVRDFFPKDQFIQNYIFKIMRETVESFGFNEYGASILEPAELYKQKSGEEIVNEQTYTFKDRGDREVTLRPEMTPTVARMVASKIRELSFPIRWYSIPNLFRYEKPQRGRLREHYQLNVDIFGIDDIWAELEIIQVGYKIMKNLGAKDDDFVIYLNSRKIIENLFDKFNLNEEQKYKISKIIDKKEKITKDDFANLLTEVLDNDSHKFISLLESTDALLDFVGKENDYVVNFFKLTDKLIKLGIKNIEFKPTLMRGFDYYTDIVFEFFDTNKENNRSLFGGGRYDDLISMFGDQKISAVGFGMGDVTARDFLETRNMLPKYQNSTKLYICIFSEEQKIEAFKVAEKMRSFKINTSIDDGYKKIGDQIKYADKNNIPFIICIGEDELKTGLYKLKNLETKEEFEGSIYSIIEKLKNA
jgi:histidyl-tRNA synthetase